AMAARPKGNSASPALAAEIPMKRRRFMGAAMARLLMGNVAAGMGERLVRAGIRAAEHIFGRNVGEADDLPAILLGKAGGRDLAGEGHRLFRTHAAAHGTADHIIGLARLDPVLGARLL